MVVGRGAMDRAPILDLATYLDLIPVLDIHDHIRPFQARERLRDRLDGGATMSIWTGSSLPADAYAAIDGWIDAIRARGGLGKPGVIAAQRPAAADDRCMVGLGASVSLPDGVVAPLNLSTPLAPDATSQLLFTLPLQLSFPQRNEAVGDDVCARVFRAVGDPRMVAGGPLSDDVIKCRLKPVDPSDYARTLSEGQLAELRRIFPGGVCDWSRPGVGEVRRSMLWPSVGAERLERAHGLRWRAARSAAPRRG
jgi:hypothetical protein